MSLQDKRRSGVQLRFQRFVTGAALLLVVGIGSDLQAQMQCSQDGGGARGGQMAGRAGGPGAGAEMGCGAGVNQMAQMMQMMQLAQQAQQFQQMQRQTASMQQTQVRQDALARQQQLQNAASSTAVTDLMSMAAKPKPTVSRRERLRALILQRREEQSLDRPSRRDLVLRRSSDARQVAADVATNLVASDAR
ncbi:MAG: hypothetical protein O3B13_09955 [Planctomycetota bacterium]|nr:hypothetical protein [Planctomycetota bacterium]